MKKLFSTPIPTLICVGIFILLTLLGKMQLAAAVFCTLLLLFLGIWWVTAADNNEKQNGKMSGPHMMMMFYGFVFGGLGAFFTILMLIGLVQLLLGLQ